jgi:bacterioferritin-associated ferredoxin
MIVCSCTVLTATRILATAEALAAADRTRPVTPRRLFKALGTKPQCGICFTLMRAIVAEAGISFTCPEPLASQAEAEPEVRELRIEEPV